MKGVKIQLSHGLANVRLLLLAVLILITGGVHAGSAEELSWTGCGITKLAFMEEIASAFAAQTGDVISLSGGGATLGIRSVAAGTSHLGGTCRPALIDPSGTIHTEEQKAKLVQVAWDAIVMITHPENPVNDITMAQLKAIYQGEITNWKDLGGADQRIVLVTREGTTSGVGHMFRRIVFNDPGIKFKARSFEVKSSAPLEKKVEKTQAGLGATGVSSARKREVKILSLDGVQPVKENIASGKYPLWRPLYIVKSTQASPQVEKVIEFALSPEGQKIISEQGTVNLEEGRALVALWEEAQKTMGIKKQ